MIIEHGCYEYIPKATLRHTARHYIHDIHDMYLKLHWKYQFDWSNYNALFIYPE